jgi:hypothetical protein
MTYEELLAKIDYTVAIYEGLSVLDTRVLTAYLKALRAVVELHKPEGINAPAQCANDHKAYPCLTIQTIEQELI